VGSQGLAKPYHGEAWRVAAWIRGGPSRSRRLPDSTAPGRGHERRPEAPEAGQACSGFLVEQDGFRLLADLGYATVPRLLELVTADQVDAVFISHGHPDHCADLNPLLRARALREDPAPPLPVYALPGAVDAVLALDRPGMLAGAVALHEFRAGATLEIGPYRAVTRLLPHWVPNMPLLWARHSRWSRARRPPCTALASRRAPTSRMGAGRSR
jgi:ribonuclease BN (tRNA processing enzyme)